MSKCIIAPEPRNLTVNIINFLLIPGSFQVSILPLLILPGIHAACTQIIQYSAKTAVKSLFPAFLC